MTILDFIFVLFIVIAILFIDGGDGPFGFT
jgi:hypothetical protein